MKGEIERERTYRENMCLAFGLDFFVIELERLEIGSLGFFGIERPLNRVDPNNILVP